MNSKMMALAAVLVVGVLAAAGVGYAYTATYQTGQDDITTDLAVVTDFTDTNIDYNTVYTNGESPVVTSTIADSTTFTVKVDVSKVTGDFNKLRLTGYTIYYADNAIQTKTAKTVWTGTGDATFTAATETPIATGSTVAITMTDTDFTKGSSTLVELTLTLAGVITSDKGSTTTTITAAGADNITAVELIFTPVKVV